MLRLSVAPRPLLVRRDRPFQATSPVTGVGEVLRYVASARRTLSGPLALELEGPGDPLASPDPVLRILALLHEHHPDVVTGLVVDGPLLCEYGEDLAAFGLRYLVLRMDATTETTARRVFSEAYFRGELLGRDEAAALAVEETHRAFGLARRAGLPLVVRFTLIPTVNAAEAAAVARVAGRGGASRVDLAAHDPFPWAPLARAGIPTPHEMERASDEVARAFAAGREEAASLPDDATLGWLTPDRTLPVDVDLLQAADVLSVLPDPAVDEEPGAVLPPRTAQLVAVASADGSLVDLPLSLATSLRIYAVTAAAIRLVGIRPLPHDFRRRHDGVGHAPDLLEAVVGCRALVATQIGKRAVTLLSAVGLRPVAASGPLLEVLDRVARGTLRAAQ
jgi:nitrogen fixation protein NifB